MVCLVPASCGHPISSLVYRALAHHARQLIATLKMERTLKIGAALRRKMRVIVLANELVRLRTIPGCEPRFNQLDTGLTKGQPVLSLSKGRRDELYCLRNNISV